MSHINEFKLKQSGMILKMFEHAWKGFKISLEEPSVLNEFEKVLENIKRISSLSVF